MRMQKITKEEYDELNKLSEHARWEVPPTPDRPGVSLSYRSKEYQIRQNKITEFWQRLELKYDFKHENIRGMKFNDQDEPVLRLRIE